MQGRRTNQQILEGELDAFRFLLAFDASRQPGNVECHWMHWQVIREAFDEFQTALLLSLGPCAIRAMHELRDAHHGYADLYLAPGRLHLFQNLPNSMVSPLGGNDDAGIENYSHFGGFHGLR